MGNSNSNSKNRARLFHVQCKGICTRYTTRKGKHGGYEEGGRRCSICERFYEKSLIDEYDLGIRCPCCNTKTAGKSHFKRAAIRERLVVRI